MTSPVTSQLPSGSKRDGIIEALKILKLPVTRENYLDLSDPDRDPNEPLHAESESMLPLELQLAPPEQDHSLPAPPSPDSPQSAGGTKESSDSESVYDRELLDGIQERRPDLTREQLKRDLEGHGF
jgi:hypothetical protein